MLKTIRSFEKGLTIAAWSGTVAAGLFGATVTGIEIANGVSSYEESQHDPLDHPLSTHISESLQNSGFDAQVTYVSSSTPYDVSPFVSKGLEISTGVAAASFVVKKVLHEDAASTVQTVVGTRDFDPYL